MGSSLEKLWRLFQCWFKLTSICPSKYYFLQSFPGFYSISFHGFKSEVKWEDCKFVGDFYSKAQRALLQNEVFTICFWSSANVAKFNFWRFSLLKKSKNGLFDFFYQIHSKISSQKLNPKIFSRFDFYNLFTNFIKF